jgi:hypothetical protein
MCTRISLGFGGLYVSLGDHIGHFYQTRDERETLLLAFLKTGLEEGDRCVYLINQTSHRQAICEALAAAQIKVKEALASGQLILDEGKASPQELRSWFISVITRTPERFRLLRWGGDMAWSLKKMPTSETLMAWETMCNLIESPPAVFLCQYDLTQFLGSVVLDAMKTHPLCIIGNVIHRNPFYSEPAIFLKELQRRQAARMAS